MNYNGLEDELFEAVKDYPGFNNPYANDYNAKIRLETKKILQRALLSDDCNLFQRLQFKIGFFY